MKGVSVLVTVLSLASALSLEPVPFKLREVTHKSIYDGVGLRIYEGDCAQEGQFPFMVFSLMRVSGGRISQCSASLIKPDLVLLAAHCVYFPNLKPKDVILVAGKADVKPYVEARLDMDYYAPIDEKRFDLQERRAKEIHIHPKYDQIILHHDIALLRLDQPFRLVSGVVENITISKDQMKSTTACTILGWGLTRGNVRQYKLNFVKDRQVSTTRLGCLHKPSGPFICLRPSDSGICQGDSGSPLVCGGSVWGVASHFVSRTNNPDCGDSLEEYYSEVHPNLEMLLPIINGAFKSAAVSVSCLFLCLFAAISSAKF